MAWVRDQKEERRPLGQSQQTVLYLLEYSSHLNRQRIKKDCYNLILQFKSKSAIDEASPPTSEEEKKRDTHTTLSMY